LIFRYSPAFDKNQDFNPKHLLLTFGNIPVCVPHFVAHFDYFLKNII